MTTGRINQITKKFEKICSKNKLFHLFFFTFYSCRVLSDLFSIFKIDSFQKTSYQRLRGKVYAMTNHHTVPYLISCGSMVPIR